MTGKRWIQVEKASGTSAGGRHQSEANLTMLSCGGGSYGWCSMQLARGNTYEKSLLLGTLKSKKFVAEAMVANW